MTERGESEAGDVVSSKKLGQVMSIFKGKNAPQVVSRCRRGKSSRQYREEDEGSPAGNVEMCKTEVWQVTPRIGRGKSGS